MDITLALAVVLCGQARVPTDQAYALKVLAWPSPPDVERDFVEFPGGRRGLGPPMVACAFQIESAWWSPDGSRLLIVRRTPKSPAASELALFDVKTGRTSTFWSFDPEKVQIEEAGWMIDGTVALTTTWPTVQDPDSSLISLRPCSTRIDLLDLGTGRSTTLVTTKSSEHATFAISTTQPFGVVWVDAAEGPTRFASFGPHGQAGETRPVTNAPPGPSITKVAFDATGNHPLVRRPTGLDYDRLNLATGRLEPAIGLRPWLGPARKGTGATLAWTALPAESDAGGYFSHSTGSENFLFT